MLHRAVLIVTFFAFCHASAGHAGMVSGGAELQTDQYNPWFLQNIPQVSYCIAIDPENFGVSLDAARQTSFEAIDYWKREFDYAIQSGSKRSLPWPFQIATQKFAEVDCGKDHDLTFQFGTLDSDQLAQLGDVSTIVGIAVRIEYDVKKLRGKGYIYISPESGPLALRSDLRIKKNRWTIQKNALLKQVLIHELGHIFGLRHNDVDGNVMQETFAESLISTNTLKPIELDLPFFALVDGYVMKRSYHIADDDFYTIQKILGVPQSLFEIEYTSRVRDSDKDTLRTYELMFPSDVSKTYNSQWISSKKHRTLKNEIKVFLTRKQDVDPKLSDLYLSHFDNAILPLYDSVSFKAAGMLMTSDRKTKSLVIFEYSYGALKMSGFGPTGEVLIDKDFW